MEKMFETTRKALRFYNETLKDLDYKFFFSIISTLIDFYEEDNPDSSFFIDEYFNNIQSIRKEVKEEFN